MSATSIVHKAMWRETDLFHYLGVRVSTQPYQHLGSAEVDVWHDTDLPVLLLDVILVDADGVDPEGALDHGSAEKVKGVEEIARHLELLRVEDYFHPVGFVSPHVREGLVSRALAEQDLPDAASERIAIVLAGFNLDKASTVVKLVEGLIDKGQAMRHGCDSSR